MVVGGAGFVGSHLVDALLKHGAEKVVVVDNMHLGTIENLRSAAKTNKVVIYREDARYLTALENIIDREKPEAIFNLAVKCLPYGFVDPEGSFMTGVEIAQNLANLLRKKKYRRMLHFSSSEAYGSAKIVPMSETHPLDPTTPYGAGKAAADLLLQSYHKLFNIEIGIIRPFNLYGPRQNMDAYAAVIPVTINRILHSKKPIIEGDGLQTRDFTYVGDAAEAAIKLMNCESAMGEVVNVGQNQEHSIKEVISTICKELNYPDESIEYTKARPSDVRRLFADVSLAKKLIAYSPQVGFAEGIRLTVKWFKERMSKSSDLYEVLKYAGVQF
jgi:UDP-glucose 4-epimerase